MTTDTPSVEPRRPATTALWKLQGDYVVDRDGLVWRVVRDGGMATRADFTGIETIGIEALRSSKGPLTSLNEFVAEAAAPQPAAEAMALRKARLWIVGVAPHLHEVFNHRLVKENGPGTHEACMHPDCQTARSARAALAKTSGSPDPDATPAPASSGLDVPKGLLPVVARGKHEIEAAGGWVVACGSYNEYGCMPTEVRDYIVAALNARLRDTGASDD